MPPRGLQSTFKNRRKAPDHLLPIITQGFNPGRPCASEGFNPGRLWETLGGPVRRRVSVLGGSVRPWEALCVGGFQSWEALGDPGRPCASEDFSPGTGTCTLYPAPAPLTLLPGHR